VTSPLLSGIALPANIGRGHVYGRFGVVDDGLDFTPATDMRVIFTPMTATLIDRTADPDPLIIALVPTECTIDSEGYLVGPNGGRGCALIATDDTDVEPIGWTYRATFVVPDQVPPRIGTFYFAVPTDSSIDLVTLTPVNRSEGFPRFDASREHATTVGDGVHTTYAVEHTIGSRDVRVDVVNISNGQTSFPVVQRTTESTLYLDFGDTIPAVNSYRVLISKIG
jgi:hypothetical protein